MPDQGAAAFKSDRTVEYFDSHAGYYQRTQYEGQRRTFINARHEKLVALLDALPLEATGEALDAGCGPGNLVVALARRGGHVTGLDASPRMLEIAQRNAGSCTNVTFALGSVEAIPRRDAAFDLVCSSGVIEYLERCEIAIREMHRVLRAGGTLVITNTNPLAPGQWFLSLARRVSRLPAVSRALGLEPGDYRLWLYRIPEFKRLVRACGFELADERYFYFTLPRPLNRLFPRTALALERACDRLMHTPLRHLAEGYILVAHKPH